VNTETRLMHQIMLALSEAGCTVWRNNTGQAWHGKVIHKAGQQVTLSDAWMQPYGICVGSSDLIGIATDGRFLAIEVKTATGRVTKEQQTFIDAVCRAGGRAGIARSVNEALEIARQARA
jgi:hypothetical protein